MNTATSPTPATSPTQRTVKAHHAQRVSQQRISNGKKLFDELLYFKTDEAVFRHLLHLTFLKSWTLCVIL